jgi:hypothetical protein
MQGITPPTVEEAEPEVALPAFAEADEPEAVEAFTAPEAAPVAADASLSAIVQRLEAALAERAVQLSRLETLAANLPEHAVEAAIEVEHVEAVELVEVEEVIAPPAFQRPTLEAVETTPRPAATQADDMDAALRSALETLHRMNARTR